MNDFWYLYVRTNDTEVEYKFTDRRVAQEHFNTALENDSLCIDILEITISSTPVLYFNEGRDVS